ESLTPVKLLRMSKKRRRSAAVPSTGRPAVHAPETPVGRISRSDTWLGLGLGLLILICYANSMGADLVFDSATIISKDPRLRAWNSENLEHILTRGYWWPSAEDTLYRPLTTFTYLLNYSVLGSREEPAGYHVVNILLHWANACLVM